MTQKSEQALISYKFQILACQISEDCDLELSEKIASQEYLHVQLEVWKKQRSGLPKLRKLIFVFYSSFVSRICCLRIIIVRASLGQSVQLLS